MLLPEARAAHRNRPSDPPPAAAIAGYEPHVLPAGPAWRRALAMLAGCAAGLLPAILAAAVRGAAVSGVPAALVARLAGGVPAVAAYFAVGAAGGVLAGLLGVGGGVVLLPLLMGFTGLSIKEASNLTIVQVVAAALVSAGTYYRRRLIHVRLALLMGGTSLVGGLVGGLGSAALPTVAVESVFLLVVLGAIALLFIGIGEPAAEAALPYVDPLVAAGLGLGVGGLAGVLGAGGGFLIVPLLAGALRLPTRLAIGTSPAVILLGATAALAGKAVSRQIHLLPAAALVAGAVPFTYLGARLSQRLSPRVLRLLLVLVLAGIAAHSGADLFRHLNG